MARDVNANGFAVKIAGREQRGAGPTKWVQHDAGFWTCGKNGDATQINWKWCKMELAILCVFRDYVPYVARFTALWMVAEKEIGRAHV